MFNRGFKKTNEGKFVNILSNEPSSKAMSNIFGSSGNSLKRTINYVNYTNTDYDVITK